MKRIVIDSMKNAINLVTLELKNNFFEDETQNMLEELRSQNKMN